MDDELRERITGRMIEGAKLAGNWIPKVAEIPEHDLEIITELGQGLGSAVFLTMMSGMAEEGMDMSAQYIADALKAAYGLGVQSALDRNEGEED